MIPISIKYKIINFFIITCFDILLFMTSSYPYKILMANMLISMFYLDGNDVYFFITKNIVKKKLPFKCSYSHICQNNNNRAFAFLLMNNCANLGSSPSINSIKSIVPWLWPLIQKIYGPNLLLILLSILVPINVSTNNKLITLIFQNF